MKAQTADVKFAIREYQAGDFDRLWEIDQICFPEGIAYTQMDLTGFITKRKAITLVAETRLDENAWRSQGLDASTKPLQIIGFVVALPVRGQIGHVVTLDIVPEARRLGLASWLMKECERRLRIAGCRWAYLETAVNNKAALLLYRKLGYDIVRTLPEYYCSQSLDAFQMAKRL